MDTGYIFVDSSGKFADATSSAALDNAKVTSGGFALSLANSPTGTVMLNTEVFLTATATGASGAVSYKWYSKAGSTDIYNEIPDATDSICSVRSSSAGTYYYKVVATDGRGYTNAAETTVYYADITVTAPTAKDLTYNGKPQELVITGSATMDATMYYSLSETDGFSTDIPTAVDAGKYTVYYYAATGAQRTATQSVPVTLKKYDPETYGAHPRGGNSFTYNDEVEAYKLEWIKYIDFTNYKDAPKGDEDLINNAPGITYYYNSTDSNENSTPLESIEINKLKPGTYYIYAVFAETDNFKPYTTTASKFGVSKATPFLPDSCAISNLTYNTEEQPLISKEALDALGFEVVFQEHRSGYGPVYTIGEDGIPYGKNAGTYQIYYNINENEYYDKKTSWDIAVEIAPKTLSETTLKEYTYGDAAFSGGDAYNSPKFEIASVMGAFTGDKVTASGTLGLNLSASSVTAGTNDYNVTSANVTLSGEDSANYKYVKPATVSLTVKPKSISIASASVNTKTYDGTTSGDVSSVTFNGLVSTAPLTGSYTATAVFSSAVPGDNIPVTVTVTLKDEYPAKNYVLENNTFTTTQKIKPQAITVSNVTVSKTYDGTDAAVPDFSRAVLDGVLDADKDKLSVSSGSAKFSSKNAGTYDNVTVSDIVLTGAAASCYAPPDKLTLSGSITPKEVTVTGITAESKTYDGTDTASLDITKAEISGIIEGDKVSVASADGKFANKNAVADNFVNLSSITLTGEDKDNYVLSAEQSYTVSAQVLPRAVTLKSESFSKAYDGLALTNGTGVVSITEGSMVTGETLDYSFSGSQTAVGTGKNSFTALSSATANAANYALTYDYGTLTVTLPAEVGKDAASLTPDAVKPADRNAVNSALKEVNGYLAMSPSEEEKAALNEKKALYEKLLKRIDELEKAAQLSAQRYAFFGVATGDESNLTLWLVLAAVSLAAAAAAITLIRKKK